MRSFELLGTTWLWCQCKDQYSLIVAELKRDGATCSTADELVALVRDRARHSPPCAELQYGRAPLSIYVPFSLSVSVHLSVHLPLSLSLFLSYLIYSNRDSRSSYLALSLSSSLLAHLHAAYVGLRQHC